MMIKFRHTSIYTIVLLIFQLSQASTTSINETITVELNGAPQRMLVRGNSTDLPILLFIHGGIGTPYSALAHTFQDEWESKFLVIHVDQRGSGPLYKKTEADLITTDNLVTDIGMTAKFLCEKFKKEKIYLMGHSWGSYLAVKAIIKYPELFWAYIGTGQNVGILEDDLASHEWAYQQALAREDKAAQEELNQIGLPPYNDVSKAYEVKYGLVAKYGGFLQGRDGMSFLPWSVIKSPDLNLIDSIRYVFGISYYEKALFTNEKNKMWHFSLKDDDKINIPFYLISGENDHTTSVTLAESYFNKIQAPKKKKFIIPNAAHFAFIDNKKEFTKILFSILNDN
jgi:pimeloyl-ACP methyl ester carboxylesterase